MGLQYKKKENCEVNFSSLASLFANDFLPCLTVVSDEEAVCIYKNPV